MSGFDLKWLLKLYTNPDSAMFVGNMGPRTPVPKDTVSADDHEQLSHAQKQKQPSRDVYVRAGEVSFGRQVSPDGVGSKRGQGLMSAKEYFVQG